MFTNTQLTIRFIKPGQSLIISLWSLGESWHNYHHAFPYDFKGDEFDGFSTYFLNVTTKFISFCEKIGLAYDLKTASAEAIANRKELNGDGSY